MVNTFKPPDPQDSYDFMDSVRPETTIGEDISSISSQTGDAAKRILEIPKDIVASTIDVTKTVGKATGRVATAPAGMALGGVEAATYLAGNAVGAVSVMLHSGGKVFSTARNKLNNLFADEGAYGQVA